MDSFLSNDSTVGVNGTLDTNGASSVNADQQTLTLTINPRSDSKDSAFKSSAYTGTILPTISAVPKTEPGSPKIISDAPLTKRYIALFGEIKETEQLMSQDGQGPAREKADYYTIYLRPGGTSGVDVHRFNPKRGGFAQMNPRPSRKWLNKNGFTTNEIWGDLRNQKHQRDKKERNPFIVVPDDMETSVGWIKLSDKRRPADALIVTYIIPK